MDRFRIKSRGLERFIGRSLREEEYYIVFFFGKKIRKRGSE